MTLLLIFVVLLFLYSLVSARLDRTVITAPIVFIWSVYDAYTTAQKINERATLEAETASKACPQCAERVNTGAKVCRFCGYEFVPQRIA